MSETSESVQGPENPIQGFLDEAVAREANWNRLVSSWCDLTQNFSFSPKAFYALVEKHLEAQKVPGLETNHVLMRESGRFSSERLYLQFRRERLVFEICGFPFGTGFFVSSRLFDRRKQARWRDYILLFVLICVCTAPFAYWFGWLGGLIAFTGIIALLWTLMRLAAAETFASLDRTLSDLPIVGLIYDRFFHPDTFYREDTNSAYRLAVESAVREAVNEMRSGKGLRPLTETESRPTMRGLAPR